MHRSQESALVVIGLHVNKTCEIAVRLPGLGVGRIPVLEMTSKLVMGGILWRRSVVR